MRGTLPLQLWARRAFTGADFVIMKPDFEDVLFYFPEVGNWTALAVFP